MTQPQDIETASTLLLRVRTRAKWRLAKGVLATQHPMYPQDAIEFACLMTALEDFVQSLDEQRELLRYDDELVLVALLNRYSEICDRPLSRNDPQQLAMYLAYEHVYSALIFGYMNDGIGF